MGWEEMKLQLKTGLALKKLFVFKQQSKIS
jgi:hypothetical protein